MATGYLVVGTDTGVGKTTAAVALIHAFRRKGLRVAAMKPVAAGCEITGGQFEHADVRALAAASNVSADRRLMNPYAFVPPIAPHIAAEQTGVRIEREKILSAYAALARAADVVIVEGVGGFRVPLGEHWDTADMAVALGLPLILVVGLRLGCLNHALLTWEAIERRDLKCAGWIGNTLDPDMTGLMENQAALRQRLPSPCLGVLAYQGGSAAKMLDGVSAHVESINISKLEKYQ